MAVDGNGEVSACGRENIRIDMGFRDDVTGASVSVSEEEEVEILSEGEDIMIGVSGADIFFDGVYGTEGQEEDDVNVGVDRDDEDEFNDYEIHIDETLEIKDYGVYDVQDSADGRAGSSDEIVSCVRAFVQSLPMPGQISPQELVQSFPLPGQVSPQKSVQSFSLPGQISPQELVPVVEPPSFTSKNSVKENKDSVIKKTSLIPTRKRKSTDLKPKECVSNGKNQTNVVSYFYMPSRCQEFEDFLNGSTKYSTARTVSHLQMPGQDNARGPNHNLENRFSEESKTDLPGHSGCDSLVSPVKDIKDSYWTDMVIQTESPVKLPSVNTLSGNKVYKPVSTRLSEDVPNKSLEMKTLNYNHVPMAATATTDKYFPAELILTFSHKQAIPSESKLYNIFRRFGTLIKTETLIHHESNCARVVFKKSSDAELAVSSATAFNIMGPSVVKYEIGYTPLSSTSVMQKQNAESEATNPQELEPEVINAGEYKADVMNSQELEPEAAAGGTMESEEYEGLDDVDIME